jgi:threonine synthase
MTAGLRAAFRCFAGCPGEHPLTRAIYTCPRCGGLLAVAHDMDALRRTSGEAWRALFSSRGYGAPAPYASGVWSKREWVAPEVTDADVVSTVEGRTPLCPAPRLAADLGIAELAVKQSGTSHTGSFKDLGMTVLVSVVRQALREGAAQVRAIACASTGDTSAALAGYGAIAGLPVVVLLPRGLVSTAQLVQPLAHGAKVLALDTDFDGCMAIIKELAARGLVYLANSMNPLRIEGQKTVAFEIAEQRGWDVPDWVVLPSGNLGNAAALHAGFAMMADLGVTSRLPRLCVAQAARANPMVTAFKAGASAVSPMRAGETLATAIRIGNPVSAPRAMAALAAMRGVAEEATEDELAEAAARADRAGLYTCPHTGVALACAKKLRAEGVIGPRESVVVVSTASGLKFTEFKLAYHEGRAADVTSRLANAPIALPPDVERVAEAIAALGPSA